MMDQQIEEIMDRTIIVPNVDDQPGPMSTALDPDDLEYHAHVIGQVKRIVALEAEITAIRGGEAMWSHFLAQKYNLGAGDTINEDGTITRAVG